MNRYIVGIMVLMLVGSTSGCGNSAEDSNPPPQASSSSTSAEGLWNGMTDTGRAINGVILDDGSYWVLYAPVGNLQAVAGLVQGTGMSQHGHFTSSTGSDFNLEGMGISQVIVSGSYVMQQTLTGTVQYPGTGGQTTFTSTYNRAYDLTPDLTLVVGTYTGTTMSPSGQDTITVTVSFPDILIGTSTNGCAFSGSFVPRVHGNVYNISVTFAGGNCINGSSTVTGIAVVDATTNTLSSAALNTSKTNGFVFIGTRIDTSGVFIPHLSAAPQL